MTISFEARLSAALDRRDVPPVARREIYNAVCGPLAKNPYPIAWEAMLAPLQAHIIGLQSTKASDIPPLREVRSLYIDCLKAARKRIRAANHNVPIPADRLTWQEWVSPTNRAYTIQAFADAYSAYAPRGNRIVPFAPLLLRQENTERIVRTKRSIQNTRDTYDPDGTGKAPNLLGALMLCACRMVERAVRDYEEGLKEGKLHPYENPAKVNWTHYCTKAMRQRVKDGLANSASIRPDGLEAFLQHSSSETES
jgi:hypothetical protein